MNGIGYLAAFLGGVLGLLSPCSALLLPAFFAYAFTSPARLLGRIAIFYAGLAVVPVPLGMGSATASRLVYGHQAAVASAAGAVLIAFGALQVAGGGFSVPGIAGLRARIRGDSAAAVLALGATSGLAGFCAGPILGAVLTVAAASGQPLRGGALLAVYAAGMTAPLLMLSAVWDRFGIGRARWLRGRGLHVRLAGIRLHLHTNSVLSGGLFICLGGVFFYTRGRGVPGLPFPPGLDKWDTRLQQAVTTVQAHVPDLAVIAVAGTAVIAFSWQRLCRSRRAGAGETEAAEAPEETTAHREQA